MKEIPRALQLPALGNSRWVPPDGFRPGLNYLSWGKRRYDRRPIPMVTHIGWVYFIVLQGTALLHFPSERKRIQAGAGVLIHPDTPCGFHAAKGASCEILTWVWESAPEIAGLQPKPGSWLKFQLTGATLKELVRLHADCRREADTPDEFTPHALRALRTRLDLALARSSHPETAGSGDPSMRLALDWMRRNLHSRQPIRDLCQYLDLSGPTLYRMFQKRWRQSPRAYFQKLRLARARQLLSTGSLLKEAALALGYAHANDLSRAMRGGGSVISNQ